MPTGRSSEGERFPKIKLWINLQRFYFRQPGERKTSQPFFMLPWPTSPYMFVLLACDPKALYVNLFVFKIVLEKYLQLQQTLCKLSKLYSNIIYFSNSLWFNGYQSGQTIAVQSRNVWRLSRKINKIVFLISFILVFKMN